MKLLIRKQSGEVIVDSNLREKDKHDLGIYASGKGDNFKIEVSLPNNIDNDFSKLFAKITWRFSYEDINKRNEPSPRTGDNINMSITVFILSAIGFLVVLFLWKIEAENIEKND